MQAIFDLWTLRLEEVLIEIAKEAEKSRRKYFIGGGFALDINLGKLTRPHEDIDFHPIEEDAASWQRWFQSKGYVIGKDPDMKDYPHAFLLTNDNNDYIADVYPVKINKHGEVFLYETHGGHSKWEGKSYLTVKRVHYKGVPIYIEDPESVLVQKIDHVTSRNIPLSDKHLHDIKLYNYNSQTKRDY